MYRSPSLPGEQSPPALGVLLAVSPIRVTVRPVRPSRLLLLLLPVLGLASVYVWSSEAGRPSGATLRDRVVSCSSRDTVESFQLDGINAIGTETQDCLQGLLLAEIQSGELAKLDPVLAELSQESPGFAQFCHTVLHWVGYELGQHTDFPARLAESGAGNCIFGYGHGLLEGFAARHPDPTDDEFAVAVTACETLERTAPASSLALCADGLGHAAWDSTQNVDRAAQLCDILRAGPLKSVCAGGVTMQMFAPVNDAASSWTIKQQQHRDAATRLAGICATWSGSPEGAQGCHTGAGYVYTRPVHVQAAEMLRSSGSRRQELLDGAVSSMKEVLDLCARHGAGGASCRAEVTRQIPPAAYVEAELNDRLCRVLTPDGSGCPLRRTGPISE